jgi:hypothetical protein
MSSNTRKTALTEDIRAWSTAIIVCFALMLGFASTGYSDTILGNWENKMDGWAAMDINVVAEPCLGVGNTLDNYSLKVAVPSGWHMAINRNSGLLPAIATATTIQVDITLKASEWVIGSGWVKPIEDLVLQDDMSSWQPLNPVGGIAGWDGVSDQTVTVTFNVPAQTGPITWAQLMIVTNYDGVTTPGNFYFDNVRIVTPAMATTKCTVTAGKTQASSDTDYSNMADSFTASGTFIPPPDLNGINSVDVAITSVTDSNVSYTETLSDFNSTVANSKHKYTHTGKIVKGLEGKITSLTLDFRQGKFAIAAKNIDLTGFACPLELKFTIGDDELSSQADETVVNGPTKTIPTRFMRMYKDTLIVTPGKTKVKSSTKASSDSLSVTGEIADSNTTQSNLHNIPVVITWGDKTDLNDVQAFTIPINSFKIPTTGHSYKCSNIAPIEEPNAKVSGTIDLDKCTFALSITKADINNLSGETKFGIAFDDFNEVADVNLAWKK